MLNFENYVARHGESGAQGLLEMIERREGIANNLDAPLSLEDRWNAVMRPTFEPIAA